MIKEKLRSISIRELLMIYFLFIFVSLSAFLWMGYSNVKQNEDTIINNAKSQLNYTESRFDTSVKSIQYSVYELLGSKELLGFKQTLTQGDYFAEVSGRKNILDAFQREISSSLVLGELNAYWKNEDVLVSSNSKTQSDFQKVKDFLKEASYSGWYQIRGKDLYYVNFSPIVVRSQKSTSANFLVLGKIQQDYLYNLLGQVNTNPDSQDFFVLPDKQIVTYDSLPKTLSKDLSGFMANYKEDGGVQVIKNSGYTLLLKRNTLTGAWLATYIPVSAYSKNKGVLWNAAILLVVLITLAFLIVVLFYFSYFRNLQILRAGFKKARDGKYDYQIHEKTNAEFNFVFDSYNQMNHNTSQLLENLKAETDLRENAELRQLQAQINPHFLYNNFNFILSMADTSPKAVKLMTEHLAEYYRYLTNKNVQQTTLGQELRLAETYLTIMSLRKDIEYFIDAPEVYYELPFMAIIIQPLVENAVVHGIEGRIGSSQVGVFVEKQGDFLQIEVVDDGVGLTSGELKDLEEKLQKKDEVRGHSIGLWNVNQRLINHYGKASALKFRKNLAFSDYGLSVYFKIPLPEDLLEDLPEREV